MSTQRARRRDGAGAAEDAAHGELGPALGFMRSLWGVNHGLESTSRRMKSRLGVTGPERMVVRIVATYPGISAGEVARILRVHPSTLTGLLKRLVSRGLVVRRRDAADERRALFTLGPKGSAIERLRTGTVEAAVRRTLASLDARDVRAAVAVLDALARALEP